MLEYLFWSAVGIVVFTYAGFPLCVVLLALLRPRPVKKQSITPFVSLIIAAYNEEGHIAARLDNALQLDYPPAKLEIIVASDGSDDSTEAIVDAYAKSGVRLLRLPRRGKVHALNSAVEQASGEILVFSDANSMYEKMALCRLVQSFADPEVGGVAGRTRYSLQADSESSSHGEDDYWNYDNWMKERESLLGSVVSAHGGIYALRKGLYPQLSDSAVTDDFAISTAVIEQGYRLVFDKGAVAFENAVTTASLEFSRKVRIMTQGMRAVVLRKRLLNPWRFGSYSFVLFSHKILRRLVPFVLILLLLSSFALAASKPLYLGLAATQIGFYCLAVSGYLLRNARWGRSRFFYLPFFYCMANGAALTAVCQLVRGQKIELWQPQRNQV